MNRIPAKEPQVNLHVTDLFNMQQITPRTYRKYSSKCEEDIYSDKMKEKMLLSDLKEQKYQ